MPNRKQLLTLFAIVFIGLVALEGFAYLILPAAQKKLPAKAIMASSHNQYLQDFSLKTGCTFAESIIVHPMLGFVHRRGDYLSSKCRKVFKANNIGILSERDLPLQKHKDEFAIMIMGGSVADHLANYKSQDGTYFLEKVLNQKFVPPKGTRFVLYNGALGAWAMPSQVSMLLMYGERIDGALSLDGYNEAFPVQEGERLEKVPSGTYILSFAERSSLKILGLRFLWAYQYFVSHTWLAHSYFFNSFYKVLTSIYQHHIVPQDLVNEFSQGNVEDLKLSAAEAQKWSLESLGRYMQSFHQLGQIKNVETAEFLQPTRFDGKTLTEEERGYPEHVEKNTITRIQNLYAQLAKQKFPVKTLTSVFSNEKESIYSDHIHYKTVNGVSRGMELVATAIADELGRLWHLKKR